MHRAEGTRFTGHHKPKNKIITLLTIVISVNRQDGQVHTVKLVLVVGCSPGKGAVRGGPLAILGRCFGRDNLDLDGVGTHAIAAENVHCTHKRERKIEMRYFQSITMLCQAITLFHTKYSLALYKVRRVGRLSWKRSPANKTMSQR